MAGRSLPPRWKGVLKALWVCLRFGVIGRILNRVGYITRGRETSSSGN